MYDEHTLENWGSVPQGRRLRDERLEHTYVGETLMEATPDVVDTARRFWDERDPDEFLWEDLRATEIARGDEYRVSTARAFTLEDPGTANVSCFTIRDDRLVPLRRRASQNFTAVPVGVVDMKQASGRERR